MIVQVGVGNSKLSERLLNPTHSLFYLVRVTFDSTLFLLIPGQCLKQQASEQLPGIFMPWLLFLARIQDCGT